MLSHEKLDVYQLSIQFLAACLDVLRIEELVSSTDFETAKALLERIVAMLSKMCR